MSSTDNLDFLEIDPNQLGKAAAANTAFGAIDEAIAGSLSLNAGALTSPYTITYSTSDEPSGTKTALRFFLLDVTGVLSANWTAILPTGKKKPFVIINDTTGGHNVIVKTAAGASVTVPAGSTYFCYLNGSGVQQLPVASPSNSEPWDVGNFIDGMPSSGLVVMRWIATRTITFPANFSNNQMKSGTPAAGTAVFPLNKNGVQVGTATFIGGGSTATWASTGSLPIVFNAGDIGTFAAPNPADAALADIVWMLSGTR